MTDPDMDVDVVVVGAGVIGQAIGWRCAQRGAAVTLLDPAPGTGASWVAAGMLAPVGEASFGEEALTALQVRSSRLWPGFAQELTAATGLDLGYRTEGTLTVALTHDDLLAVRRMRSYSEQLGLTAQELTGAAVREREPLLAPRIRGAVFAPGDHQVDPRRLLAALTAALGAAGARFEHRRVDDLASVRASTVVLAAGTGSAALGGLPVRPVKGQLLRLRAPRHDPQLRLAHTVRGLADGRSVYLVPRDDGELVIGATVEERRDGAATAGGVLELLRAATDLVPAVAEYELVETCVGHRPGTPDNGPLLGPLPGRPGVIAATGHYRHGILLTPVTADAVAELVATGRTPEQLAGFGADRWRPSR